MRHVGLPLANAFAKRGVRTVAYDHNPAAVKTVNNGQMPFDEPDAPCRLERAHPDGVLTATTDQQ